MYTLGKTPSWQLYPANQAMGKKSLINFVAFVFKFAVGE
jgi:hypothetical protein